MERAAAVLTERDARSPTVGDLVSFLGDLTEEEILEARHARQAMDASSLQERVHDDDDTATREDRIGTRDHGFGIAENRAMLQQLMRGVSQREREVLTMRYFTDMTQAEIGEHFGVSQMQISRITRGAITRMQTITEHQRNAVAT